MKKISYLLAVLVLCAISASATGISKNKAQTVATSFFQKGLMKANVGEVKLVKEYASSKDAPAAVFAFSRGENVVFVSAEDKMPAILGYTENADMDDMPPALEAMLQYYAQLTDAVRAGKIEAPKLYASAEKVDSLCKTSWGQKFPFWNLCPVVDGKNTPNGCVSTAIAQIMKYYKWPEKPTGGAPEYTTNPAHYGMKIPAIDLKSHTYNWDNMLDVYKKDSYTEEQGREVAQLCYDVAVASKMDFHETGSGTILGIAAYAMREYFGYNKDVKLEFARNFSEEEWVAKLKNELSQGRPLPFCGASSKGGHCFVIDGYNTDGLFHVNWGWGGKDNGYFLITSLDSDNPGIEGADSKLGFINDQNTLFDFFPDREGTTITTEERYHIQMRRCKKTVGENNMRIWSLWNQSIDAFEGSLTAQLIDEKGALAAQQTVLKDLYLSADTVATQSNIRFSLDALDLSTIADGVYHIELIAVSKATGKEYPIHATETVYSRIIVENGKLKGIYDYAQLDVKILNCDITVLEDPEATVVTFMPEIQFTNVDNIAFSGEITNIDVDGYVLDTDNPNPTDDDIQSAKIKPGIKELQPGETYTLKGEKRSIIVLDLSPEKAIFSLKVIADDEHWPLLVKEWAVKDLLTGIKDIKINKEVNTPAFSLDGKRVNASSAKGVIIKDGKKTLSPLSH